MVATMSSDEEIMTSARQGDASAAVELSLRYRAALERYAAALLGDPARAEDVAQETLANVIAGDAGPGGALRPWLYKLARNRCLDLLRRAQNSPTGVRLASGVELPATTTGIATRLAQRERDALVRRIVAAMPDEYRDVVVLRYFENLSREEIGEVLGLSDAAVKGRLARGLDRLRAELRNVTGSGS